MVINISSLKCGVYLSAAINRINTETRNCWLILILGSGTSLTYLVYAAI